MQTIKSKRRVLIGLVFTIGFTFSAHDSKAQKIEIFKSSEVSVSYSIVARENYVSNTYWKKVGENSYESCSPKKWEYIFFLDILNLTPYYKRLRFEVVPEIECYQRNDGDLGDGIEVLIEPNQSKQFKQLKVASESDTVPNLKVAIYPKAEFDYFNYFDLIDLLKNGAKVSQIEITDLNHSFSSYELILGGFNPYANDDSYIKTTPPSIANANEGEFTMDADTLVSQLKRDRNGKLVKYEFEMGNRTYKESFDIKKGWQVHYVSNLDTISRSGTSTYLLYNSQGFLYEKRFYIYNGESLDLIASKDIYFYYEYYPTGQLKFTMKMKRTKTGKLAEKWEPWNITDYRYPNGSSFTDYGDFKNGTGTYKILNDEGQICDSCIARKGQ